MWVQNPVELHYQKDFTSQTPWGKGFASARVVLYLVFKTRPATTFSDQKNPFDYI